MLKILNFKNLFKLIVAIFICCTFVSCSDESAKDIKYSEGESMMPATDEPIEMIIQDEPIEMIIQVEPENINLNEIPDILTITVENTSNVEWQGGYHCTIDYFDGDDWKLILTPAFIDDVLIIEPNSKYTIYVPTKPDINNYTAGKYRVKFGFSDGNWLGWYGEFSIS